MSNEKFLNVKDLYVNYTSGGEVVHAVNGVSFSLEKGEIMGLVGETGAGKTTVAKAIMRILPLAQSQITGGEITLDGERLLELTEKQMVSIRGSKVSMIFQDPMTALNPVKRVGHQIAEAVLLHNKISKADANRRAEEMLELVGIPASRAREFPFQFSGGMKQRVVIAMALACNPKLLLADEPTTALDVTIQAQVLSMIKDLQEKLDTAMVFITHDLALVSENCDNVAVIYAGEIIEYGSVELLFQNPTHPYTIGLMAAVPTLGDDKETLDPVPGMPPDPTDLPAGCAFAPRCKFATERCHAEKPGVYDIGGGHTCRCFLAEKGGA